MKNRAMISVLLSNGMIVRIPFKNWKETLTKMEENIKAMDEEKNRILLHTKQD